jgi:DNA-binding Lrp family transcriptional regulator
MLKPEIKRKILESLENTKIGLNQSAIADKTGISRPTVAKYIKLMEEEGIISSVEVGNIHYWSTLKENPRVDSPFVDLVFNLFEHLVISIKKMHPECKDWMECGRNIAENFKVRQFLDTSQWLEMASLISEKMDDGSKSELEEIAMIYKEVLNTVFSVIDQCDVDEPITNEKSKLINIRLSNSKLTGTLEVFEVLAGLIERRVKNDLRIDSKFSVEYNKEMNIANFYIRINDFDF